MKDILIRLRELTIKKDYPLINNILQSYNLTEKEELFSEYVALLFRGNGYFVTVEGSGDVLISSSDNINKGLFIAKCKNQNERLTWEDTLLELKKFENKDNCQNYYLISINGFVSPAYELEEFGMSLYDFEFIKDLINSYDEDNNAPKLLLNAHNKITYNQLRNLWQNHNRVAVVKATGTGKSYIIGQAVLDYIDVKKKVIIFAPSNFILNNMKRELRRTDKTTVFMTYQKLIRLSDNQIKDFHFDLIVFDEYHRTGAVEWGRKAKILLQNNTQAKVLGTTATPKRYLDGNRDMTEELFDGVTTDRLSLSNAIAKGILPIPKYITAMYSLKESDSLKQKIKDSFNTQGEKEFFLDQLSKFDKLYNVEKTLIQHIPSDDKNKKFIMFCEDQVHLSELMSKVPGWFRNAFGSTKEIISYEIRSVLSCNKKEIKRFEDNNKQNSIDLLFSIDMLNEGLHIKGISGVFFFRRTESPRIFYQQLGRTLSSNDVGATPLVFDLVNNFNNIKSSLHFVNDLKNSILKQNERRNKIGLESQIVDFNLYIHDQTRDALKLFRRIEALLKDSWEFRYGELVEYKNKYGNCDVPNKFEENRSLGRWVDHQRQNFKTGKLEEEKINKLNEIGFSWVLIEDQWDSKYNELIAYKNKYGNCNVPHKFEENPSLGAWIGTQRQDFKKEKLEKEKISKLNAIGFNWNPKENQWVTNYQQLVEYKNKYGNCDVPAIFEENRSLGMWVVNRRKDYNNGKLEKEKINKLNAIGFNWNPKESQWNNNYQQLVEYKNKYGNCNVPHKFEENPSLGAWIGTQRQDFKKEKLEKEKISKLNAIGFNWNPIEDQWGTNYQQLVEYKNEYGNCDVPNIYKENYFLGNWVGRQRICFKTGKLEKKKINKLNAIGFNWNPKEDQWNNNYLQLVEYKNKHRNCDVPTKFKENTSLGAWVADQRKYYKNGSLKQDKINKLNAIGFCWNSFKDRWVANYQQLIEYKNKYGNCNVPYNFKENPFLRAWVSNQRHNFKNGKMEKGKIDKLNAIGFNWNPGKDQWDTNYQQLVEYKDKYENCDVHGKFKENRSLGKWVSHQRQCTY